MKLTTPRFSDIPHFARRSPVLAASAGLIVLAVVLALSIPAARSLFRPDGGPAGPLHAEGSQIVDSRGREVVLAGVNWFGFETGTFAPHGLWARNWESMLDQLVATGFNTIRLPYSNELLRGAAQPDGIDAGLNPDLANVKGVELLDRIVTGATDRGLMVVLDRHRPSSDGQSELWYTEKVSEETWIADWVSLAERYRDNPLVVGADLHNEPRGRATWGSGERTTDWRLAAERAGNAILAANPNWLIFVEGVESQANQGYWWGGNLQGAREHPVRLSDPSKLVYSAHDYGPGVWRQSWFTDPAFPANLPALWERNWAYLKTSGQAPVLLGEFGGRSVGEDTEGVWQRTLIQYLKDKGISYTYWSWNPNSGDTGGILQDDWQTVDDQKLAVLKTYQRPVSGDASRS
jgi:endoglucanase